MIEKIVVPYAGPSRFRQLKKIGDPMRTCSLRPSMHRQPLKELLAVYESQFPGLPTTQDFIHFVDKHPDCFERSLSLGHVTGSAWIVDPDHRKTLLVHHKKLGLWLQPGGHCDGNADVAQVAIQETREETGLSEFQVFKDYIFDLDIHKIPAWKDVPEHLHYDVRFLIFTDSTQAIKVSEESNDIAWFDLEKLAQVSTDHSVLRLAEKTPDSGKP